jgi:molybdopterin-guanine dinucleotide biosynthesis protein A
MTTPSTDSTTPSRHSVIVPACGDGMRFGSNAPKHLVDIGGKPMVQRVIDELPNNTNIYLLVRSEYVTATRAGVRGTNVSIVPVYEYHRGVCDTLMHAPVRSHDKVTVINCDNVIVPPRGWQRFFELDNAIVTFK